MKHEEINAHNCSTILWLLNWHGPMCQFQCTCGGFTRTMPSILGTRGSSCGCRPMVLLWPWRVDLVGLKAWWRPTRSKVMTWKLQPRCGWKMRMAFVMFLDHVFEDMVEKDEIWRNFMIVFAWNLQIQKVVGPADSPDFQQLRAFTPKNFRPGD